MHLRQPGFTYSACGPFNLIKERIQRFKETGDVRNIFQNELDKACFQYNCLRRLKDLPTRTAADKVLRDKTFNIAKNSKCDRYQRGLASMFYKIFDKRSSGSGV